MDIERLLDEALAPLAATPQGQAAIAQLHAAIAAIIAAAETVKVDWAAELTKLLPRLVRMTMRLRP